jgi:hypothetical protein
MKARPSASMPPQEGVGGFTPNPRKERADSRMMMAPISRLARTMSGPTMFGRT